MDYKYEATKIIREHTEGYLSGCHAEYASNREMMECMLRECAFILTNKLLEGKYTPMQYAAVRNELGSLVWDIFEKFVQAEDAA
jgi:hypothetical protein